MDRLQEAVQKPTFADVAAGSRAVVCRRRLIGDRADRPISPGITLLTCRFSGCDMRLTDLHGRVITDALA